MLKTQSSSLPQPQAAESEAHAAEQLGTTADYNHHAYLVSATIAEEQAVAAAVLPNTAAATVDFAMSAEVRRDGEHIAEETAVMAQHLADVVIASWGIAVVMNQDSGLVERIVGPNFHNRMLHWGRLKVSSRSLWADDHWEVAMKPVLTDVAVEYRKGMKESDDVEPVEERRPASLQSVANLAERSCLCVGWKDMMARLLMLLDQKQGMPDYIAVVRNFVSVAVDHSFPEERHQHRSFLRHHLQEAGSGQWKDTHFSVVTGYIHR